VLRSSCAKEFAKCPNTLPPAGHPHSLLGINVREIGESFTGDNYEVAVNYARNNNYTVVTNTAL